jgi:hypothetical protein
MYFKKTVFNFIKKILSNKLVIKIIIFKIVKNIIKTKKLNSIINKRA